MKHIITLRFVYFSANVSGYFKRFTMGFCLMVNWIKLDQGSNLLCEYKVSKSYEHKRIAQLVKAEFAMLSRKILLNFEPNVICRF